MAKKRQPVKLVKIDGNTYSCYTGKQFIASATSDINLDAETVEALRVGQIEFIDPQTPDVA